MILETKLINLDNKPIKVNKKSPPMSTNKDLHHYILSLCLLVLKIVVKVMD